MIFIALSVVCSVVVSVLLKLAPRYGIDLRQAITGNYLVAVLLTALLFEPDPALLQLPAAHPAWRVLLALGILLPSIFVVEAYAVHKAGIVRTDVADRLSLLLPLVAAFTVFGEAFNWWKGVGMGLGLVAIVCIVVRPRAGVPKSGAAGGSWGLLLTVFLGAGVIDILFKRLAQLTQVPFADVLFAAFAVAFVLAVLAMIWLYAAGRARWRWRNLTGAVLLGIFNFGDIVFYVEAHRHLASNPALVFSAQNIGVIVLATLVGAWLFRERIGTVNRGGLALAVAAVLVLTVGQVA